MRMTLFAAVLAVAAVPAPVMAQAISSDLRNDLEHFGRTGLGSPLPETRAAIQVARAGERTGAKRAATAAPRTAGRRTSSRRGTLNPRILAVRAGYRRLSSLVNFPAFFPGIGVVYVKPGTLPLGPYLSFDRKDRLISTIYMLPLDQMNEHRKFDADAGFAGARLDHATMYFNGGHPGVDMPHYHYVIWHVSRKDEALVAR